MTRHRKSSGPKRKSARRQRRRYLIVAEDSKSSLDYFSQFPYNRNLVEIVSEGGAGNTVDVVQKGIDLKKAAAADGTPFVHIYCVFDKDDWSLDRYQAAFDRADRHNDLSAIWSNECFELWYLLHFAYRDTAVGRDEIYRLLEEEGRLGRSYEKGDATIYEALLTRQENALRNSKRLLFEARQAGPNAPWRQNPSTNVHEIVEQLNALRHLDD